VGKVKIAQILARAGLHLAVSSGAAGAGNSRIVHPARFVAVNLDPISPQNSRPLSG